MDTKVSLIKVNYAGFIEDVRGGTIVACWDCYEQIHQQLRVAYRLVDYRASDAYQILEYIYILENRFTRHLNVFVPYFVGRPSEDSWESIYCPCCGAKLIYPEWAEW